MKKLIIFFGLMLYVAAYSNAQENPARKVAKGDSYDQTGFYFGANGALNVSFIMHQFSYGGKELDYAQTIRGAGGLIMGYNIIHNFGIAVEGYYSGQGQNYEDNSGVPMRKEIKLDYLQVPVMLKLMSGLCRSQFYIMAGPQFGFLQSESITINGVTQHPPTENGGSFFVNHDLSARFEIGDDLQLIGNLYFHGGLNFNMGFNDINQPALRRDYPSHPYQSSNNAWGGANIGLHYMVK